MEMLPEVRRAVQSQLIDLAAGGTPWSDGKAGADRLTVVSRMEELFNNRPYILSTCILMSVYALVAAVSSPVWTAYGEQSAKQFRFTALELRGGQMATEPSVAEFGVLARGCMVILRNATVSGASLTMHSSGDPIVHDGWWLRTLNDDNLNTPVRFKLEASNDGVEWRIHGGSTWLVGASGHVHAGTGRLAVDLEGGETLEMHHREGWPWVLRHVYPVTLCAGLAIAFGFALSNRLRSAAKAIYLTLFTNICMLLAISVGFLLTSNVGVQRAPRSLVFVAATVWTPFAIEVLHLQAVASLLICGVLVFLGRVVEAAQLDMWWLLQEEFPFFPLVLVSLTSVIIVHRARKAVAARQLVRDDKALFDERWEAVQAQDSGTEHLRALRERVEGLQARTSGERRHFTQKLRSVEGPAEADVYQPIRSELAAAERRPGRWQPSGASPVESLEQLYAQSAALRPILRDKVLQWACASSGLMCLPRADGGAATELVTWQQAERDGRWRGQGEMPCKTKERARAKAKQCYRSDVSRLLDITRHRIVFEDLSALVECLAAIARDKEVKLVHARNGMALDYDADNTAGYRDVKLNIRIQTQLTQDLGIDGHVCEVLLVHKEMVTGQTQQSHQRYAQLRTLRQSYVPWETLHHRSRNLRLVCGLSASSGSIDSEAANDDILSGSLPEHPLSGRVRRMSRVASLASTQASTADSNLASIAASSARAEPDGELLAQIAEFRKMTCLPGWFLQHKVSEVENAISSAHTDSLLFTSRPLLACMTRRRWQGIFFVIGLVLATFAVLHLIGFRSVDRGVNFRQYRFTPLELRDGSTDIERPHIRSFGVRRDLCGTVSGDLFVQGRSMVLSFENEEAPWVNGWAFTTSDEDVGLDPVRFRLEGSMDARADGSEDGEAEAHWEAVTGIYTIHDKRGSTISNDVFPLDTPTERNASVVRDLRMPVQTHLTHGSVNVIGAAALMSAGLLGRCGRPAAARDCILFTVFIVGLMAIAPGIMWLADGATANGEYWIVFSLPVLGYCFCLIWRESLFVPGAILCGVVLVVWEAVAGTLLYHQDFGEVASSPTTTGMVLIFFGVVARLYRLRSMNQCKRLVARDKAKYDQLWQALVADHREAQKLQELAQSAVLLLTPESAQSRQYNLAAHVRERLQALRRLREADEDSRETNGVQQRTGEVDDGVRGPEEEHGRARAEETAAGVPVGPAAPLVSGELGHVHQRTQRDANSSRPQSRQRRASRTFPVSDSEESRTAKMFQSTDVDGCVDDEAGAASPSSEQIQDVPEFWAHQATNPAPTALEEGAVIEAVRLSPGRRASEMQQPLQTIWNKITHTVRHGSLVQSGVRMLDVSAPITSLDQLYAQAGRLDPMLRIKVQDWAAASRGMFPLQASSDGVDDQQFVLWEEAASDPARRAAIKWGQVKSPDRAVEKALRSYRQDVSRLLDVCRQQIVFQSTDDMLACLRAIGDDDEVVVVRVKNKMHLDHNSATSAGYRDLSLNLRILSEEANRLGLAGHVCEVQLQLESFARLRNSEGHKRYVRYRNFRAE